MSSAINETVGRAQTGAFRARCQHCGGWFEHGQLNWEALIHHNARRLECLDRKACERRARKKRA